MILYRLKVRRTALLSAFLVLLASLLCPLDAAAQPVDAALEPEVVMVQPIITRMDDGSAPANCRIQEAMIDGLYATAGVDFYFLEPIYWDNTTALQGEVDVGVVVGNATRLGLYRGDERVSNVMFVDGINGRPGPAGLARQPGWHVFISMVDPDQADSDGQDAFVVAHECGHNLGLAHAVDDAQVPNDRPNVMGDGPFEERVGPDGINDYQVQIIRSNPLSVAKVRCLDIAAARRMIIDESFETYFAQLQPREVEAFTGQPVERGNLDAVRATARERFQQSVRAFTEDEAQALAAMATRIDELLAGDMPLLSELPWTFIKVDAGLCGGFAHTRSECIIFSERITASIAALYHEEGVEEALLRYGPLLVHEQLHVLQRMHPKRFASLYGGVWGFVQAQVQPNAALTRDQVTNPDGVLCQWLVPIEQADGTTTYLWPRTLLRQTEGVPRMGHDFMGVMVQVVEDADHRFTVVTHNQGEPAMKPLEDHADYLARFPIRNGHDHPNEIAAYLFEQLFLADYLLPALDRETQLDRATQEALAPFRTWCQTQLAARSPGDYMP